MCVLTRAPRLCVRLPVANVPTVQARVRARACGHLCALVDSPRDYTFAGPVLCQRGRALPAAWRLPERHGKYPRTPKPKPCHANKTKSVHRWGGLQHALRVAMRGLEVWE